MRLVSSRKNIIEIRLTCLGNCSLTDYDISKKNFSSRINRRLVQPKQRVPVYPYITIATRGLSTSYRLGKLVMEQARKLEKQ